MAADYSRSNRVKGFFSIGLIPLVGAVVVWEVLSRFAVIHPIFFPPPTEIAVAFVQQMTAEEMVHHTFISLQRVVTAFVLGSVTGITTGLIMGWSRYMKLVLNPFVGFLYPIPKIVLLPIMFSVFGVTETARILTMAIAVFLLVTINTMGGVEEIEREHVEVALDNDANTLAIFTEVILPASMSQIFSGLSLGFGIGFILIVVIEMVAADQGLGFVIWNSWELFTVKRMYVALVNITILGVVSIYGLELLGDYLTPWAESGDDRDTLLGG